MTTTSDLEANLDSAKRRLYHVFVCYRGRDDWCDALDGLSDEQRRTPAIRAIAELTDDQVDYFSRHAFVQSWPDNQAGRRANELSVTKYFLPRSLDVVCRCGPLATDKPGGVAFEESWIIERINRAQWHEWPAKERMAVKQVLMAWFELSIHLSSRPGATFDFLKDVGVPLSQLLAVVKSGGTQATAEFASDLVRASMPELISRFYLWPEAECAYDEQRPLVRWLMHPGLARRLESFFFQAADGSRPDMYASDAVQWLDYVRKRWREADDVPRWVLALLESDSF